MVRLISNGLNVNGVFVPVYSGTVHYWRHERALWPHILDQCKALGFNMIETYMPWGIHETARGQLDFGAHDRRKDLEVFIRLCEEKGLWLLARPGPLINAELTDFGFPEWVLMDPAVQAQTAVGSIHFDAAWGLHPPHQFPVPSYASDAFYDYVAEWFDVICPIIARHLPTTQSPSGGCIVAVQSDNETCYLFHDQPYATDYSPASLALYQKYLIEKYGSLSAVRAQHAQNYADGCVIEPPRDCELHTASDLPRHIDWIAYKEYQIIYAVSRIAHMLCARGIEGVPIFHDVAYQYRTPLDIARMEADPHIDWVGMNLYRNVDDYDGLVKRLRFLSGATRLPFVPELGCGLWSHHPLTPLPNEQAFITTCTLMFGLKAFNLYMLVERERWQGCPVKRDGDYREDFAPYYRRLMAFLHDTRFWEFRREVRVLVLFNYDLGRVQAATSTLNYAHADLLGLPWDLFSADVESDRLGLPEGSLREADEGRGNNWLGRVWTALRSRGIDFDLADTHVTERASDLGRYTHILVQDFANTDATDRARINALQRSDRVVAWGEQAHATISTIAPDAFHAQHEHLDIAVHRTGARTLVFASNFGPAGIQVPVTADGAYRLTPLFDSSDDVTVGPVTFSSAGTGLLTLASYSVQVFEAERLQAGQGGAM